MKFQLNFKYRSPKNHISLEGKTIRGPRFRLSSLSNGILMSICVIVLTYLILDANLIPWSSWIPNQYYWVLRISFPQWVFLGVIFGCIVNLTTDLLAAIPRSRDPLKQLSVPKIKKTRIWSFGKRRKNQLVNFENNWPQYSAERLYLESFEAHKKSTVLAVSTHGDSENDDSSGEIKIFAGQLERGDDLESITEYRRRSFGLFAIIILLGIAVWSITTYLVVE
jgi:hypothetical protein